MTNDFLLGSTFIDTTMSSEWGTFEDENLLPTSWGLDYAGPNDDRPRSGVGKWELRGSGFSSRLILSGTAQSDGTYTDFTFYTHKGQTFAVPTQAKTFIIGPDKESIEDFYDTILFPVEDRFR